MSTLQELRSLTGGGQNTTPSCVTIALLCIGLSLKSSTLQCRKLAVNSRTEWLSKTQKVKIYFVISQWQDQDSRNRG